MRRKTLTIVLEPEFVSLHDAVICQAEEIVKLSPSRRDTLEGPEERLAYLEELEGEHAPRVPDIRHGVFEKLARVFRSFVEWAGELHGEGVVVRHSGHC